MTLFYVKKEERTFHIQIFAVGKKGAYNNIFTVARIIKTNHAAGDWHIISGPGNCKMFERYLYQEQGQSLLAEIKNNNHYIVNDGTKERKVIFGNLLAREDVFVPNIPGSAAGYGWWPGTLNEGFFLKQWYRLGFNILSVNEHNFSKAFMFIKKRTGVDIEKLQDFLGSVIYIYQGVEYKPVIKYNPDNGKVVFSIKGPAQLKERRVIIELWEGKECCYKQLFELKEDQSSIVISAPFTPVQLGYELYEKGSQGQWQLKSKARHYLMRKININMGMVTGKLNLKKPDGEVEEHDIVVRDRDITIGNYEEQPWVDAERLRIKLNRGRELKELGSIFVRFSGEKGQKEIREIINSRIYERASRKLWIWDPYIDQSILAEIIVNALKKPGLDIRLLLSEYRGERTGQVSNSIELMNLSEVKDKDLLGALEKMTRCKEICNYLFTADPAKVRLKEVGNLKIRNWFRAGKHAFHDRFIITETSVWHLGSSIKDIGNYHSTIYRLDGDMPDEVRAEFERAWKGDFKPMEPSGIQIFPELVWLNKKEG